MSSEHYCGTCGHFGSELPPQELVQIRINPDHAERVVAGCHAPAVAQLHLLVTPRSRCDAWTPAA